MVVGLEVHEGQSRNCRFENGVGNIGHTDTYICVCIHQLSSTLTLLPYIFLGLYPN